MILKNTEKLFTPFIKTFKILPQDTKRIKMEDIKIHSRLAKKYSYIRKYKCFSLYYDYWHETLAKFLTGTAINVLECGCGTGELLFYLKSKGINAFGFDVSKEMLLACFPETKNNIFAGDAQYIPLGENLFDAVICKGSLHHVDDPKVGLAQIYRVLKPDGKVIISEPCRDNRLWKKMANLYTKHKSSFSGNHKNFTTKQLQELSNSVGFKIAHVESFGFLGFLLLAMPQQLDLFKYMPFSGFFAKILIAVDRVFVRCKICHSFCWHKIIVLSK